MSIHEIRVTLHEIRVAPHEIRVATHEMRVALHEIRPTGQGCAKYKHRTAANSPSPSGSTFEMVSDCVSPLMVTEASEAAVW